MTRRPGNNEIRGSNYNGQFNSPNHMLTLADVKALQEDSQVGGKIKLKDVKKFGKDFSKGFAIGFNGVMGSAPAKMIVGQALNRAMSGGANPYMDDEVHLEGGGLGSMVKKVAKNKMVKGLTKQAINSAVPMVSNAIAAKTGIDPNLTRAVTRAAANQINEQVIGSGFGSFMKKAASNKIVKGLAKTAIKQAVPVVTTAISARTGLPPTISNAITKAAANAATNQIGSGLVGVYNKGGKRTRKKAGPNDKRSRRGALVSQLMRENGMTLAQASRYIRDNNIQY